MARIVYQDKVLTVPNVEMSGAELCKQLQVPEGHDLVLVRPEGNVLVSHRRKVRPVDNDYFVDAPTFEYGHTETG